MKKKIYELMNEGMKERREINDNKKKIEKNVCIE